MAWLSIEAIKLVNDSKLKAPLSAEAAKVELQSQQASTGCLRESRCALGASSLKSK